MNHLCENCEPGTTCKRHNIVKSIRMVELCSGRAATPDCGLKYWQAWEGGEMEATAPLFPHLTPRGFCSRRKKKRNSRRRADRRVAGKPGTELKLLLRKLGFAESANCGCKSHMTEMNRRGINWCEDHIDKIVLWMKSEAVKQELRFSAIFASLLVRLAIRRARKKEKAAIKQATL